MATWQPITRICSPGVVELVYLQSRLGPTNLIWLRTSHYSMVLSDVWRSGRCLHPPRQGGGCVCLDISAGQSAGHCWSPCLSRPHLACHLENGSGLLKMAPDLPQLWRGRAGPGPVRPRPVSSGVMILINVIQTMNTKWPAVRTRRPLCPL